MPKFFRSMHFRLGLSYAMFFAASAFILGGVIVFTTGGFLERQLRDHVQYSANQLLNDYYEDGLDELRHDIRERVESDHPDRLWYFLRSPDGRVEFDELTQFPEPGWHKVRVLNKNILLLSIALNDGYKMAVAISLESVEAAGRALRNTFMIATALTLVLSALGGFFLSRASLVKLENLKATVNTIGQDDLHLRVPLSQSGDEFDELSVLINRMLSRIETLVREVQGVSANVAHDLRTPLGRMKQKLETLSESPDLLPAQKEKIDEISGSLDEALTTFSAILRIAEVNSGTRRSEFKSLELSTLLEKIRSAYEPVVEDSHRKIIFEAANNLSIVGDAPLLTQLLANLIENTLQHTAEGTVIEVRAFAGAGGKPILSIADNGAGISADEREKITQPFFKVDRSRNSKGSGLGLSLVAAIAKLHDAGLQIHDNQPGTRIEIRFA
ncbi:MAG: HAMP domain-containing histidine kinase [Proteobacteria bacterium]|nr:MAG: HAMP domain-containing histidine kinase [Pseudomonadota bacterium]